MWCDVFVLTDFRLIGSIVLGGGCVMFGLSSYSFDGYIPALALISIGGAFIFMAVIQSASVFPRYGGYWLGLIGGAYGLSAGIFYVFQVIGTGHKFLFMCWVGVSILCAIGSVVLLPSTPFDAALGYSSAASAPSTVGAASSATGSAIRGIPAISNLGSGGIEDSYSSISSTDPGGAPPRSEPQGAMASVVSDDAASDGLPKLPVDRPGGVERRQSIADPFAAVSTSFGRGVEDVVLYKVDHLTAREALRSTEFIFLVFVVSIWMLRINFYLTTVQSQFETLSSDDEMTQHMSDVFSIMIALGGFAAVLCSSYFIDSVGIIGAWTVVWYVDESYTLSFRLVDVARLGLGF